MAAKTKQAGDTYSSHPLHSKYWINPRTCLKDQKSQYPEADPPNNLQEEEYISLQPRQQKILSNCIKD